MEIKKINLKNSIPKCKPKSSALKVALIVWIFLLGFIIGFCLGSYFYPATKSAPSEDAKSVAEIDEDSSDEKDNNSEITKLEGLKSEFISIMNERYPTVDFSFLVKNLDTGTEISHNNKQMNSASVIKLFILETVYSQMANGNYELSPEREKELELMITESNNDAANNFIDDFGGQNEKRKVDETNIINKTIAARGYKFTELNRKMHNTTPPEGPSGYQNYTSVEDVCAFLEGIYNKTLLKEPYNTYTLNLMKKQTRRAKIPGKIDSKYPDVVVANKTGELSDVENDVALIMCEDFNLIFVVMTDKIPAKSDGSTDYALKENVQSTISELGLKLVEFYKENKF